MCPLIRESTVYLSHISHWNQSPHFSVTSIQGIVQILQLVPSPSSSRLLSFDNSVKLLHSRDEPSCFPSWGISSFTTVHIVFPSFSTPHLPPPPPQKKRQKTFLTLFCCNKCMSVSFSCLETFTLSSGNCSRKFDVGCLKFEVWCFCSFK